MFALVAGVGLASQAAINSQLSKVVAGQPLIAALISFATGTLALLVVCLLNKFMGRLTKPCRTTVLEIYWQAVRCIGGIYHDFSCAEGWHYQYAVFYYYRTVGGGDDYRSFWLNLYAGA